MVTLFKRWIGLLFGLMLVCPAFGWNATGHRLVAQIAYHHLTKEAKQRCRYYEHALNGVYKVRGFVDASVWLDTLRYQDIHWFDSMHYIDIPFSTDQSPLLPPQTMNAVWAIDSATKTLKNPYATPFDKGVALRVMSHVVGDLHQPLHAASRFSATYPLGDKGGNLVTLSNNRVAKNLHAYWDKGGGFLFFKHRPSNRQIESLSRAIEGRKPCQHSWINPSGWAAESHALAVSKAYLRLPHNHKPDKIYQQLTETITEAQMALAGCRLAALMNQTLTSR